MRTLRNLSNQRSNQFEDPGSIPAGCAMRRNRGERQQRRHAQT